MTVIKEFDYFIIGMYINLILVCIFKIHNRLFLHNE